MKISVETRRNIVDFLRVDHISWNGRLGEIDFLKRLFDLKALPSHDGRFPDAEGDIWQHRVNNYDWDDDWVLDDERFGLLGGSDESFLRFLCEMLHPVVRPDADEVAYLLQLFNDNLAPDGWQIVERMRISGRPVFSARPLIAGSSLPVNAARKVAVGLNTDYLNQQIIRMESAVQNDPELAIGTAKEFVETICKTILDECGVTYSQNEDMPKLVRLAYKQLRLVPDDIPDQAKAAETIRRLLMNLATVSDGLAELRNPYGTGHGKAARSRGLSARHAKLAVGAASTLAVFLFETYEERKQVT